MAYISAWNTPAWSPELKQCPLLEPQQYIQTPVPLLVYDPSMYKMRPCLISSLNPVLLCGLVREFDCEWLMVCISGYHHVSTYL